MSTNDNITVNTVKGPINTADLGRVLMHEHVFVLSPEYQQNYPEAWGSEDDRVADAVQRLTDLKAAGIDAILDPTALGLGRYIPRIARIAEQLELHILSATGLYTFDNLPFYFKRRVPGTGIDGGDPMADHFVRDITEGIADTNVKAAVLKCATDEPGVTPDVERVLRAVADAHRRTGVPITTHTHARSEVGLAQQEIFRQEGVDLTRVIIGHCGDTDDLIYLEKLIDAGSYLGMDRFGIDALLDTPTRVSVVAELCKRGYADRLVLSHDASCYLDWIPGEMPPVGREHWTYLHISNDVIPLLLEAGVTEAQIDIMLRDNPRRIFEVQGAYT
ncbi:MAG: phosphotriesterase family protein [Acidimicrobiales bacterium]|jgi:phosphotriesterase-related protein